MNDQIQNKMSDIEDEEGGEISVSSSLARESKRAEKELGEILENARRQNPEGLISAPGKSLGKKRPTEPSLVEVCLFVVHTLALAPPGGAIGVYERLIRSSGCRNGKGLEEKWKKEWNKEGGTLSDAVEELWEREEEWDKFLEGIDQMVSGATDGNAGIEKGTPAPADMVLTKVDGGNRVELGDVVKGMDHKYVHLVLLRHFA